MERTIHHHWKDRPSNIQSKKRGAKEDSHNASACATFKKVLWKLIQEKEF